MSRSSLAYRRRGISTCRKQRLRVSHHVIHQEAGDPFPLPPTPRTENTINGDILRAVVEKVSKLGEPKRSSHGLFFRHFCDFKHVFFTMHISAMVPPRGPAGTSRAFPQRVADPCGRVQSFGTARPWLRLSLVFGPVLGHPATHTSRGYSRRALLALGSRWPLCIPCPRPVLQNCRHDETHNLGHHRHCSTVRNFRTYVAINSCTSPRCHIGTSIIPSPATLGADPASACFFWRNIAIHIPQKGSLSPGPLWVHLKASVG